MISKKCTGCGMELQFEDEKKEGYVPEEKFILEGDLLCQRYFKIKNYGKNSVNNFKSEGSFKVYYIKYWKNYIRFFYTV